MEEVIDDWGALHCGEAAGSGDPESGVGALLVLEAEG